MDTAVAKSEATDRELFQLEMTALRQELYHLKSCQVTFLTFSVTATGVLLGMGGGGVTRPNGGLLCLAPLVVLLPFWWVFFDKATTITRIVGYCRVLEGLSLGYYKAGRFTGWENALRLMREEQEAAKQMGTPHGVPTRHLQVWRDVAGMFALQTSHRYWIISYYTFFGLSVVCLLTGVHDLSSVLSPAPCVAAIASIGSAIWNARTVYALIHGDRSYNANEEKWRDLLRIRTEVVAPVRSSVATSPATTHPA